MLYFLFYFWTFDCFGSTTFAITRFQPYPLQLPNLDIWNTFLFSLVTGSMNAYSEKNKHLSRTSLGSIEHCDYFLFIQKSLCKPPKCKPPKSHGFFSQIIIFLHFKNPNTRHMQCYFIRPSPLIFMFTDLYTCSRFQTKIYRVSWLGTRKK